jgi:glutamate--cysteine ligase
VPIQAALRRAKSTDHRYNQQFIARDTFSRFQDDAPLYRETDTIVQQLARHSSSGFDRGLKGLEKESLRVSDAGAISAARHPVALGSALTHGQITTDYSEALLEFVTSPGADRTAVLDELADIHRFVYRNIGEELLWGTSMPCVLASDDAIPIAEYGSSNVGRMKHVYRLGLGYRYGRPMQAIAGVHFNYSPPERLWECLAEIDGKSADSRELRDPRFMGMVRNLKRSCWLVAYLFGASPAVCKSFVRTGGAGLRSFDQGTWFYPHGTSLRLSEFGYSNRTVGGIAVSYDSLGSYVDGLRLATETPHSAFQRIGINVDGDYRQLNANLLQIENEYYSYVRPKRAPSGNEKRTTALAERGIEYIELRSLDLDPWSEAGVADSTMAFLELYMLHAMLLPSPLLDANADSEIGDNLLQVASRGRETGLQLQRDGAPVELLHWGAQLLDAMEPVAALLDGDDPTAAYSTALSAQRVKLEDPSATPSAEVLREMRERSETFYHFAMRRSQALRDSSRAQPLSVQTEEDMLLKVSRSLEKQREIEAAPQPSFEQFLREYFAQP